MKAHGVPIALSIAGSDPTGGAGFQLDLRVFTRLGVHGMAVPTALIAQSGEKVVRVLPAFPSAVAEQLSVLLADIVPDAIKIGLLATDDIVLRAAAVLEHHDVPRVVDPVLHAGDGTLLLERRAWGNLLERVVRGAALVTPNLPEAEALTGEREPAEAARVLLECGADAVLVKGGHAEGNPDDLLATRTDAVWIRGERQQSGPVRGTGCALSSAIAAGLAQGKELEPAVRDAKRFVQDAIAGAFAAGHGARLLRV